MERLTQVENTWQGGSLRGNAWVSILPEFRQSSPSDISSLELDICVWMRVERSKLKTGKSDWHLPCNRSHGTIWNYLWGEHSKKTGKKYFIEERGWRVSKVVRSAGELEGRQANGMLSKSTQGNVSRREHVSELKAVFNFGKARDSLFGPFPW